MLNMVTLEELDDDFELEVREECENYGPVKSVVVHTSDSSAEPSDPSAVQIYILYVSVADAIKARSALDQRWFGGKVVQAFFFDEERFSVDQFL